LQLGTNYKTIEEVSLYNLKLKGKNFRSAILFTLARAIFKGAEFERSREYYQVMTLAACIEIAHNASLLQDDIIDKAESRRSVKAAH
jgi:geranylgeranyl pyrophosphate synthase